MKSCALKLGLQLAAFIALIIFVGGFLWSLFPMGGNTLPHWVETRIGIPFSVAALLVSLALGMVSVLSMSVAYVGQEVKGCGKNAEDA